MALFGPKTSQAFIGAMNLIGSRYHTFARFYRHSFIINIDAYDAPDVDRIFSTLCEWHFAQGFADKVAMLTKVCYFVEFGQIRIDREC